MRRLMSTAKTTMHPAASSQRNYMLDVPAAIRQLHQIYKRLNPFVPNSRSFSPSATAMIVAGRLAQLDMKRFSPISSSSERVTPPKTHSRRRL